MVCPAVASSHELHNSPRHIAMLDVRSQDRNIHSTYSASDSSSSYGEDETEYTRDVESGVGMLCVASFIPLILFPNILSTFRTAVEALVLSEYQPSRTLIFSLMLGEVRRLVNRIRRDDV